MTEIGQTLKEEYVAALHEFLKLRSEKGLQRAYEVGRKALTQGLGGVDLTMIHQDEVLKILQNGIAPETSSSIVKAATSFLSESLSPFEMTHRGYREANIQLQRSLDELTRTQEELIKSEEMFRSLIENALDIITILEADGTVRFESPSLKKVLGYEPEELTGKSIFDYVHPDDVEHVKNIFATGIKTPGYTATVEFRFQHKDRSWRFLQSIGKNLIHNPVVSGVIVNSRDLTERKVAEEFRRQYEFLVNTSGEFMTFVRKDFVYEAVNDAYCRAHRKKRDEIVGKTVAHIWGQDVFKNIIKRHLEACFEGNIVTYQSWFEFPSLGLRFFDVSCYPYYDSRGKVTHATVLTRDVTEAKLTQEKIRKNENQLAEAQQIAHIGSWEWDTSLNVVMWSDELYRIYGLKPQEKAISYESFLDFVHPDDREMVEGSIKKAVRDQRPVTFYERIVRPDGTLRILQSRGVVVADERGRAVRMYGTCQDVTERKQSEDALKALTKRIVEAQEEERQRVARELHDGVCQRLTAMRFYVDPIESMISKRSRGNLLKVRKVKKQIDDIISDVRRLSSNLRPTTLDHFGLLTSLRLLCKDYQKASRIQIRFRANESAREHYESNVDITLYRIAQEALSNIVKHSKAKKAVVDLTEEAHKVSLIVHDDGKGFDLEAAQAGRNGRKGVGQHLGLISMRERAELLGGEFTIESTPNNGTKIHVEISLGG